MNCLFNAEVSSLQGCPFQVLYSAWKSCKHYAINKINVICLSAIALKSHVFYLLTIYIASSFPIFILLIKRGWARYR